MVRHAPIHRRSGHSDIAICCGRNVRGSSPSTSVVPLSNQVTTLNHKRFKGFKMFSDGHLADLASNLPALGIEMPDIWVRLKPTSPLRSVRSVEAAIAALEADPGLDSV